MACCLGPFDAGLFVLLVSIQWCVSPNHSFRMWRIWRAVSSADVSLKLVFVSVY